MLKSEYDTQGNLKNQNFKREVALVTYYQEIVDYTLGCSTSVEFNFEVIWEFIKKTKNTKPENFNKDALHFFHTHDSLWDFYSQTDEICMKALNIAFGYSVNFWILTIDNCLKKYHYIDGTVLCVENISFSDFNSSLVEGLNVYWLNKILSGLSRVELF